jgi:hypothetical protein
MLNKNNFFTHFLGQNKKRKILIGVDASITKKNYKQFLNLFQNIDYSLIIYSSNRLLEKELNNFRDIIFVILTDRDIEIKNIDNDKRLFVFQLSNKKIFDINILENVNIINLSVNIEDFYLSKCYINYYSMNNDLYVDISGFSGFGLFTRHKIDNKKKLFSLNGEIVNQEFLNNQNFHGEWNALKDNKFLVRKDRTSYGFINHSRTPNCKIDTKTMDVIAIRDIKKDNEILLDYRKEPLPKEYINGFGKSYL